MLKILKYLYKLVFLLSKHLFLRKVDLGQLQSMNWNFIPVLFNGLWAAVPGWAAAALAANSGQYPGWNDEEQGVDNQVQNGGHQQGHRRLLVNLLSHLAGEVNQHQC